MEKLIIIKLGGSVITNKAKAYTARRDVIRRLGKEIVESGFKGKFVIVHGGGSFPHVPAKKYQTHLGFVNENSLRGLVETSLAAQTIGQIVMEELVDSSLKVVSITPRSIILSDKKNTKKIYLTSVYELLKLGIAPVLFGDVILDVKQGCCIYSAEMLIGELVKGLNTSYKLERVIYCGDTDGVLDVNGETIRKITKKNIGNVEKAIIGSVNADVTGGMMHKVKESLELVSKFKLKVYILNGNKEDKLKEAIAGNMEGATEIS